LLTAAMLHSAIAIFGLKLRRLVCSLSFVVCNHSLVTFKTYNRLVRKMVRSISTPRRRVG
jgi:hypothetical protein